MPLHWEHVQRTKPEDDITQGAVGSSLYIAHEYASEEHSADRGSGPTESIVLYACLGTAGSRRVHVAFCALKSDTGS